MKKTSANGGPVPKFKKDDIIIPRASLKDKDWRAQTIVVTEQLPDGTVLGYPGSGGFSLRIPPDAVKKHDLIKVPEMMLGHRVFFKARFTADWLPEGHEGYVGWTTGELWNGWGVPYFEPDVAARVVKELSGWSVRFDAEHDEYVRTAENNPEEHDVAPADTIEVEAGRGLTRKIKVYGIGAGSWTWDEGKPL